MTDFKQLALRFGLKPATLVAIGFASTQLHISPAIAQDRNDVIAQKLYSKLEAALASSDPGSPDKTDALVLAMPGYVLEKSNFDYSSPDDIARLNNLVDRSLSSTWRLRLSPDTSTSSIYNNIIGNHVNPVITLSPQEKAQLVKAQQLIFANIAKREYSSTYKRFESLQTTYYTALNTLQNWQTLNPHKTAPAAMTVALLNAKRDWDNVGQRQDIYAALSIIETFGNREPAVYWGSLRALYDSNQGALGAGTYPIYNFFPSYPSWMDNSVSWTTVSLKEKDLNTIQTSSHVSWGGNASASWGLSVLAEAMERPLIAPRSLLMERTLAYRSKFYA